MGVMGMTLIIIIFLITIYMIFRMYKNNINKILLYTIFIIVNFIIIGQFYIPYKDLNVIIIVNLTLAVLVNKK